ncbi:MAG: hypothetical protein JO112_15035, partial [Planctomycetes bacterium]|nr:hypothetical protein [Planctomycetota bacterium]
RALALVSLPSTPCRDALADRLAAAALPPGPLLVVSPRPSPLADHLAARLHRPAAGLDVSSSGDYDFFERALAHAS